MGIGVSGQTEQQREQKYSAKVERTHFVVTYFIILSLIVG